MSTQLKLPARKGWFDPCGEWIGSGYDAEWNAALDEVARLNQEQVSPAPELDRPEVVAMPSGADNYGFGYVDGTCIESLRSYRNHLIDILYSLPDEPLIRLSDYDRIVGALRRQVSALALGAEQAMEQRDAAQARVVELESQLIDASSERNAMQRQRDNGKRLFERECDDADELIRLIGFDPEQYRTDGGSINLPKLRAAVAQAGQVPDIDAMVSRFLSWPLPIDLCADLCASMPNYAHRHGTNLMNAEQAKAMLKHVLDLER